MEEKISSEYLHNRNNFKDERLFHLSSAQPDPVKPEKLGQNSGSTRKIRSSLTALIVHHLFMLIGLSVDKSFFLSFLALSLSLKAKGDFFGVGLGELERLAPADGNSLVSISLSASYALSFFFFFFSFFFLSFFFLRISSSPKGLMAAYSLKCISIDSSSSSSRSRSISRQSTISFLWLTIAMSRVINLSSKLLSSSVLKASGLAINTRI